MTRFSLLVAILFAVSSPAQVHALDPTSPRLRIGFAAGALGTLPLGEDVASGGGEDEFEPALWVQVEPIQLEVGAHVQITSLIRVSALGGYNGGLVREALDPQYLPTRPSPKLTFLGLGARVFPLGTATVRPFLFAGLGYASMATRYRAISPQALQAAEAQGLELDTDNVPDGVDASAFCEFNVCVDNTRRHRGLGLAVGVGVRLDPTVQLFSETWVLPCTLELSYTAHVWLKLLRDPEFEGSGGGLLAGPRPRVDFLGLLATFGFLR